MSELLTEEQKNIILEEWNSREENPPSLLELIRLAFPDKPDIDGRSKEGRSVKAFLATRNLSADGAHVYKHKDKIDLTEEQIQFIENNAAMMKALEIAKVIFKNNELTNLNQETRTVSEYIKSLDIEPYENTEEVPAAESYKPPKTFVAAVARVNKYVPGGINKEKITRQEKKNIETLMKFLETYRFVHHMNHYQTQTDRELYESSFIRYTYDKPDLTQEEVDQYIVLSIEVVISANIQRRVEHLQDLLDDVADDTEGRRISMSLVESISSAQGEYHQCINRQQKLLEALKTKRSDRLKNQIQENASVLNLVQIWKEEESREKLIKLAQLRKQQVGKEVENLSDMDEIKCKIMGLSKGEVLDE
tara:strand:- start:2418 stop:3506 length:1089 start_codon:yes stop_codon:yes gene_type:complete